MHRVGQRGARISGRPGRHTKTTGTRALALAVACLGTLMVLLDANIVYVALPTIRTDLGLPERSLIWVVNAYTIPYGGLLPLSGRLGDYYGHRRIFLIGIIVFTLASLVCGIAGTLALLAGARAVQGAAAAAVSTVSVSSIMQDFQEPAPRARAMALYCGVQASGSSAGLLLGGLLTHELNWRWIFLVNLPIGILICLLHILRLHHTSEKREGDYIDFSGAVTVTTSLLLMIASALNAGGAGWLSTYTLAALGGALSFLGLFIVTQTRSRSPLLPRALLRERNLRVTMSIGALRGGALTIWAFICALYLQRILGYDALELGLSFLPATLIIAMFSLSLSAKMVRRFGSRAPLTTGTTAIAAGLLLLARVPTEAHFWLDILPGMLLIGLGAGMASSAYFLSGLRKVSRSDYGIASAMLNSSPLLGGAVVLAFVAGQGNGPQSRSAMSALNVPLAQTSGYGLALALAALLAGSAALVSRYLDE